MFWHEDQYSKNYLKPVILFEMKNKCIVAVLSFETEKSFVSVYVNLVRLQFSAEFHLFVSKLIQKCYNCMI